MNKLAILCIISVTLIGSAKPSSGADFKKGFSAFQAQDYSAALKEFEPLARQGNAAPQYMMGRLHDEGWGVPENDKIAVAWYTLAAEQGVAPAEYHLGVMYDEGKGVREDDSMAVKWYMLSAEQGVSDAQANLGLMYFFGQGIPQDYVLSHMWSNIAIANGNENGSKGRDLVNEYIPRELIAEAQILANECIKKNYKNCGR